MGPHSHTYTTMHPLFAIAVLLLLGDFCITSVSSKDHEQSHSVSPQRVLGSTQELLEGKPEFLHAREKREVQNEDIERLAGVFEKLFNTRTRPSNLETAVSAERTNGDYYFAEGFLHRVPKTLPVVPEKNAPKRKKGVPICRNCRKRSTGAFSSVADVLQQWQLQQQQQRQWFRY